jgi:two-component system nitrate/nitrite sensor histidine kinase NarX
MLVKVKNSIVFRVGALLTAMTAMAIVSMFSSFIISEMADSDAAAINISGSLRKQSYQMLSQLLAQEDNQNFQSIKEHKLLEFENILTNPVLVHDFETNKESHLTVLYRNVATEWQYTVSPLLKQYRPSTKNQVHLIQSINLFVEQIDSLVFEYQREAEGKIEMLRIIQLIALFATLILVYVAMTNIYIHVEQPLKLLTEMAQKMKHGELGGRIEIESNDELGVLAGAFNSMSESLREMYDDLEQKVENKTQQLKRSNDALKFLFDTARRINEFEDDFDFQPVLDEVSRLTELTDLDLCLSTPESVKPYIHMLTLEETATRPSCDGAHCDACQGDSCFVSTGEAGYQIKFPLVQDDQNYGVLVVRVPFTISIDSWQHQLLQSVSDQIAVALSLRNQSNQERRVSLLNERTIIARELHDSLAQSLSYLKIQVTRLQKSYDKGIEGEVFQELIDEIREGLSSAYRQLRELLSTFRLKIDGDGLKGALTHAVEQLTVRSDMEIELNYDIDSIPLAPNEEIHLLQVAKESLQNAIHHSKGTKASLHISENGKRIKLKVCDNGVGIPDDPEKLNHYGLAIMKERSKHLNGALKLYRQETGGTCVEMEFCPQEFS